MFQRNKKVEELDARVAKLESSSKKDNVIWEASFKKSLRLARRSGAEEAVVKVLKGPGVIREFKDSNYLVIAYVDSDEVTFVDKYEADEINLDHPGVEVDG